ncbi:MAG: c-type cytochrome [Polyangiales bacterium]
MLSKSAARAFFVVGTVLCSGVFIFLTIDTFRKIPAQTHAQNITDSVKHGKELWEENNCMGCHTLFGEGAYYAPELTKVYERRGPVFIDAMLKDPQAMYPDRRKMQQYDFSDAERADLIAFLKWCGEVDLNGFPPEPVIGISGAPEIAMQPEVFSQLCTACHQVGGNGGKVGPALDAVGTKFDAAYLEKWLRDPAAVKPGTAMPKLPLSDADLQSLVAYLQTLKGTQP